MKAGSTSAMEQKRLDKKLIAIFLCIIITAGLCSCSQQAATVSLADLKEAMNAADKGLPEMSCVNGYDEEASDLFEYLCDLPYDKVEDYFFEYSSKGTPHEIAVIVLKDASDASEAEIALKGHVQDRVNQFKTYAPKQVPAAQEALVFSQDRYAVMVMCEKDMQVKNAFVDFIKASGSQSK